MRSIQLLALSLLFFLSATCAIASEQKGPSVINNWLNTDNKETFAPENKIHWKFSHPAPEFSILAKAWQQSLSAIAANSGHKIAFKTYANGTLYGVAGGFKAIRSKISDFGTCYSVNKNKGFELLKTFHLPFVASSNPYLNAIIINQLAEKYISPEFLKQGVYPAHIIPLPPLTLMSKTPIKIPKDLQGKKVISFLHLPGMAKTLGYTEIKLPFTEIYTALQQGIIDVIIWADTGFIPYKIYEQAKFHTELNISSVTIETCFNKKSFDSLPKKLKQQLYNDQQKIVMAAIFQAVEFSKKVPKILEDNNVTIITLSDTEHLQWSSALSPAIANWFEQCERRKKDCRALVKDINRLQEKYKNLSNEELIKISFNSPTQGIIKF